jgi:hypothetical protein|tara:strand:+ start:10722 stop:11966 length:1245 start_codon:yes stop_codon:yes gene_type:complete
MTSIAINIDNYFDLSTLESTSYLGNTNTISVKPIKMLYANNNTDYYVQWYILHYLKENINPGNIRSTGLFRSVLTNGKKIYVFSPPKSLPFSECMTDNYNDYILEELVEGTMINLFWNDYINDWDMTTKGSIGGRYSFYQDNKKTFREMFLEAMIEQQVEFSDFNKKICYSFVLQHPENRIVVPFKEKKIILVAMYSIDDNIKLLNKNDCDIKNVLFPKTLKQFTDYKGENWEDLNNYFKEMDIDYQITGVNIYNPKTGERSKIRNPNYEYVRHLKGNSPKIQYQYYCLRNMGKVKEFLKYYGEYRNHFAKLRETLHNWTGNLHKNYISCYIKKEKPLMDFPKKYRTHMFLLHQIYINDLREMGHYVSKQIVVKYVNSLEPAKLMYSINFDFRKNREVAIINETAKQINQENLV